MKFDEYEYEIGAHFLSALINGDTTGLEDNEERDLDAWVTDAAPGVGHWSDVADSDNEFGTCDVTGLRGATVKVLWMRQVQDDTDASEARHFEAQTAEQERRDTHGLRDEFGSEYADVIYD